MPKTYDQAEVKENDGTLIVSNRGTDGEPFLTGRIIISNKNENWGYSQDIRLTAVGIRSDGTSETIFLARTYSTDGYYGAETIIEYQDGDSFTKTEPAYSLSDFVRIIVYTTNGKITKSDAKVRNGSLYITIREYDFTKLPGIVLDADEKAKQRRYAEAERYAEFCKSVFVWGKALYEERILPPSDRNIPILIKSYGIKKDALDGIDVSITFQNVYDKTIKYVDFVVTPYNRVDDVTYSTLDRISTRTIQSVDFVEPDKTYTASWRAVWYNPTIAYIKINTVKVTFSDNTTLTVQEKNLDRLYTARELTCDCEFFPDGSSIRMRYDASENELSLQYGLPIRNRWDAPKDNASYTFRIESFPTELQGQLTSYDFNDSNTFVYRSATMRSPLLADAKSGHITLPASVDEGMLERDFTAEELQFIRECTCIWYYVDNKDKDFEKMIELYLEQYRPRSDIDIYEAASGLRERWGF